MTGLIVETGARDERTAKRLRDEATFCDLRSEVESIEITQGRRTDLEKES